MGEGVPVWQLLLHSVSGFSVIAAALRETTEQLAQLGCMFHACRLLGV